VENTLVSGEEDVAPFVIPESVLFMSPAVTADIILLLKDLALTPVQIRKAESRYPASENSKHEV
jgi:hypothetical protein